METESVLEWILLNKYKIFFIKLVENKENVDKIKELIEEFELILADTQ
tara:strand:+ start:920 stop:1063 length:144 start_codon:yes stop_codon:yes gene_type:complete